jgi:hypothetical protein
MPEHRPSVSAQDAEKSAMALRNFRVSMRKFQLLRICVRPGRADDIGKSHRDGHDNREILKISSEFDLS